MFIGNYSSSFRNNSWFPCADSLCSVICTIQQGSSLSRKIEKWEDFIIGGSCWHSSRHSLFEEDAHVGTKEHTSSFLWHCTPAPHFFFTSPRTNQQAPPVAYPLITFLHTTRHILLHAEHPPTTTYKSYPIWSTLFTPWLSHLTRVTTPCQQAPAWTEQTNSRMHPC